MNLTDPTWSNKQGVGRIRKSLVANAGAWTFALIIDIEIFLLAVSCVLLLKQRRIVLLATHISAWDLCFGCCPELRIGEC